MKELEKQLSQKTTSLSEVKQQLKAATECEERAHMTIRQLEDQVSAFTMSNLSLFIVLFMGRGWIWFQQF